MANARAPGKLNKELEDALAEELKLVRAKHKEDFYEGDGEERKLKAKKGDYIFGTVERMRVIDRALKWETVKLKTEDPEWGKEFEK